MITVKARLQISTYIDYLGYVFAMDPKSGHYKVTNTSDLGKLLIAYARVSDKPVQVSGSDNERVVEFDLPLICQTQDLQNKFLYYSAADMERLQSVLKASFNMDFYAYYLTGLAMGRQKKEVIEMFIVSRNLINADPYEALHKRVYRLEQKKMYMLTDKLRRKARYFEESLDIKGLIND